MFKRIVVYILLLSSFAYVVAALAYSSSSKKVENVKSFTVKLSDFPCDSSLADVEEYFQYMSDIYIGNSIGIIDYNSIETLVASHSLVKKAECYVSPSGGIVVNLWGRIPIVRVFTRNNESFYIGDTGEKIEKITGAVPYVPIMTAQTDYESIRETLFDFLCYIYNDAFWRAQVEQINVSAEGEVEIVPRVGKMRISIGDGSDFVQKLDNAKFFYEEAIAVVGWDRYSRLNVEFNNQIIAEK